MKLALLLVAAGLTGAAVALVAAYLVADAYVQRAVLGVL